MNIDFQIGPEIIKSYQRLSYTPWHAIAEFVDNSTQSYFNNRSVLDKAFKKEKERLQISIAYDKDKGGMLRISDNALGMSFEDLQNALILGKRPTVNTGRSQFGLGLKTAACWVGNQWSIITKRLGEPHEHHILIDVDKVAKGNPLRGAPPSRPRPPLLRSAP